MFQLAVLDEFKTRGFGVQKENHLLLLVNLDLEGNRISEVAERSGLSRQTVGPLIREMTKRGIVALKPDPTDGRAKLVVFTEKGIEQFLGSVSIIRSITHRYTEIAGQHRMTQLQSTLKVLLDEFEKNRS